MAKVEYWGPAALAATILIVAVGLRNNYYNEVDRAKARNVENLAKRSELAKLNYGQICDSNLTMATTVPHAPYIFWISGRVCTDELAALRVTYADRKQRTNVYFTNRPGRPSSETVVALIGPVF